MFRGAKYVRCADMLVTGKVHSEASRVFSFFSIGRYGLMGSYY
jgi:hypothetical protein